MPIATNWTAKMSVEQLQDRLKVFEMSMEGRVHRGLRNMLKKQQQEILDELKLRGITCQKEDQKVQKTNL